MTETIAQKRSFLGGNVVTDCGGEGESYGHTELFHFPNIASLGAGVAITTIQGRVFVPYRHRLKGTHHGFKSCTAVSPGTDPAVDVRRHLPKPTAPTLTLGSAPGNTTNGTRKLAVTFTSAAGDSMPSEVSSITIADKDVIGKFTASLPIGPTGTTGRKLWSTEAGCDQLKLAYTIADNTTEEQEYNLADGSLGANIHVASTAAASVLAATLKLSAADRSKADQPLTGTLADGVASLKCDPCIYDVRVLTGALTGAIADVATALRIERITETD